MGMAPGGKIKKPKTEVEEHLHNFLAIADAMAENKNWAYLAQYSILKEMLADLHTIAGVRHGTEDEDTEEEDAKEEDAKDE